MAPTDPLSSVRDYISSNVLYLMYLEISLNV
jgi:hypothetical protein